MQATNIINQGTMSSGRWGDAGHKRQCSRSMLAVNAIVACFFQRPDDFSPIRPSLITIGGDE